MVNITIYLIHHGVFDQHITVWGVFKQIRSIVRQGPISAEPGKSQNSLHDKIDKSSLQNMLKKDDSRKTYDLYKSYCIIPYT